MKLTFLFLIPPLISLVLVGCQTDIEQGYLVENEMASSNDGDEQIDWDAITIFEGVSYFDNRTDESEEISYEDAGRIGIRYLKSLFDINLEGIYVDMRFNYNHHISHSTWTGTVMYEEHESGELDTENWMYMFTINAFTGEVELVVNWEVEPLFGLENDAMSQMSHGELSSLFPEPDEEEWEQLKDAAYHFAEIHFGNSDVSVEAGLYERGRTVPLVYEPTQFLNFVATDAVSEGVIEMAIQRETKALFHLSVPFDIIAPDFSVN